MSNFNITDTQAKLAKAEELIEITKKTREDAIKAKTESQTKLNICKEELAKLGVTPENAESELARLESEIQEELNKINNNIPFELLRQLQRI